MTHTFFLYVCVIFMKKKNHNFTLFGKTKVRIGMRKGCEMRLFLVQLAVAPVFIGLFFIYIKDKYEKEPWHMLFLGLFYGMCMTAVIYMAGIAAERVFPHEETPLYTSFVSSAGIEETIKYIFLILLIWKNKNFNEPLDGIVYGVFVSMGFAGIENIIYVFDSRMGGYQTAMARAVLSVPSHGLFGVLMGYHLGLAKFSGQRRQMLLAWLIPYFAHALYNLFLLEKSHIYWIFFGVLQVWLWWRGILCIKRLTLISPFRFKKT